MRQIRISFLPTTGRSWFAFRQVMALRLTEADLSVTTGAGVRGR